METTHIKPRENSQHLIKSQLNQFFCSLF